MQANTATAGNLDHNKFFACVGALETLAAASTRRPVGRLGRTLRFRLPDAEFGVAPEQTALVREVLSAGAAVHVYEGSIVWSATLGDDGTVVWSRRRAVSKCREAVTVAVTL